MVNEPQIETPTVCSPLETVTGCSQTPSSNYLARCIRFLRKFRDYRRTLGPRLGVRWFFLKTAARLPIPGTGRMAPCIRPPALAHPVRVRMLPSSDDYVFDQVFVSREHEPLGQLESPGFILDLGANVGYASALFASRYPKARILALEPDPVNFGLCTENLDAYGSRVRTLQGAIWPHCSRLALSRGRWGDGLDWAVQVHESRAGEDASVVAWDVPALLDLTGEPTIDLVKIDIEGSEAELFAENTEWLACVRNICIELHGERCREIFFRALDGYDYDRVEHGENTVCLNLRRRA
jgi:FkbM family methyltransferase